MKQQNCLGCAGRWLEGQDDRIYDCYYCYKAPLRFFEDLRTLQIEDHVWPLEVFCSVPALDYKRDSVQALVPVLKEKCTEIGDQTIYRYRVYGDGLGLELLEMPHSTESNGSDMGCYARRAHTHFSDKPEEFGTASDGVPRATQLLPN